MIDVPITRWSPPNRRIQNPWLRTAVRGAPGASCSGAKSWPCSGRAPSIGSRFDETRITPTRSGSPLPVIFRFDPNAIASCSKPVWCVLMSKYCAVENQSSSMFRPGDRFHRIASRSASAYGSGRTSSAYATLKIAVFAPMPIASDKIAAVAILRLTSRPRRIMRSNPCAWRTAGGGRPPRKRRAKPLAPFVRIAFWRRRATPERRSTVSSRQFPSFSSFPSFPSFMSFMSFRLFGRI